MLTHTMWNIQKLDVMAIYIERTGEPIHETD